MDHKNKNVFVDKERADVVENVEEKEANQNEEKSVSPTQTKESKEEKKSRMRSIMLANVAVCIMAIGFTVISPGMYPYMKQVRHALP